MYIHLQTHRQTRTSVIILVFAPSLECVCPLISFNSSGVASLCSVANILDGFRGVTDGNGDVHGPFEDMDMLSYAIEEGCREPKATRTFESLYA